jgi:hypothetical protein
MSPGGGEAGKPDVFLTEQLIKAHVVDFLQ